MGTCLRFREPKIYTGLTRIRWELIARNSRMIATSTPTILTEVFPIKVESVPRVSAYRLEMGGGDLSTVGGKLSYRLKREFQGHWVWTGGRITTDCPREGTSIMNVVETLWTEQPEIFRGLQNVYIDANWRPNALVQADFVARGLVPDYHSQIQNQLSARDRSIGNARVERVYRTRGWVVNGEPALSLSIFSRLLYTHDLSTYSRQVSRPTDLIGLFVADKTSDLKADLTAITGVVHDHRSRLLALTKRDEHACLHRGSNG